MEMSARAVGIVAEYNPFHNGHAWQIRAVRERCPHAAIVAVMSGSYTQRGEAALLDKWQRAGLAVRGGVDLVLELPFVFACRSAQDFARGALRLFGALGIVDAFAFGAECDDLPLLKRASEAAFSPQVQAILHAHMQDGNAYARALAEALEEAARIPRALLRAPNNILAVEYLRACAAFSLPLAPILIARHGASHGTIAIRNAADGSAGAMASGSAIRHAVRAAHPDWAAVQAAVPAPVYTVLRESTPNCIADEERLFCPLLASLIPARAKSLRAVLGMGEGLENRLLKVARKADSLDGLVSQTVTSRYPASRIRRLIPHLLLGVQARQAAEMDAIGPRYARVLAFSEAGRALLHRAKRRSAIPLITKTSAALTTKTRRGGRLSALQEMLALDTEATELRALCVRDARARQEENDFLRAPRFVVHSECAGRMKG